MHEYRRGPDPIGALICLEIFALFPGMLIAMGLAHFFGGDQEVWVTTFMKWYVGQVVFFILLGFGAAMGVYIYMIRANTVCEQGVLRKGTITLLR